MADLLSNPPEQLKGSYPIVVIGSGYGGSILSCRLAMAGHKVCLIERGAEWEPGTFPDSFLGIQEHTNSPHHPLGLYEYLRYSDIDVIKGCGLGGTSLINASVAFLPDADYFGRSTSRWPKAIQDEWSEGTLPGYYQKAEQALGSQPHPHGFELAKVKAMKIRADQRPGADFGLVNINVTFNDGPNQFGVQQAKCTDCGDCMTGCNVRAKNTLYMNYLPAAKQSGAEIYTRIKVEFIEKAKSGAGYVVHYRRVHDDREDPDLQQLEAQVVIVSAGSLGSTEILLRSQMEGLSLSPVLGTRFSGNGNFFGAAYNSEHITDVIGFGNHDDERSQVKTGPAIVSAIRYDGQQPFSQRMVVEDLVIPRGFVDVLRVAFPVVSATTGSEAHFSFHSELSEAVRVTRDLGGWNPAGALNSTMIYIAMAEDQAAGEFRIDQNGKLQLAWPGVFNQSIFSQMNKELRCHAAALGAVYFPSPRWNPLLGHNLITAHPLGGSVMGDTPDRGVVDDKGRVYDGQGRVHHGLYVADGAIIPECIGRNPLLTISAVSERIADYFIKDAKDGRMFEASAAVSS
jgi:cholesterol oxidase